MLDRPAQADSKQATEADKSYYAPPPAVSLPKGGGAIKGMGEKFAANPVTGTGSMSVPIAISPGRSGFGPQLSLSYDSGAGNGIFGLGWNLSLSSITRKTDKGLPRYWDGEESDVFMLSGAEDLMPVLRANDSREVLDSPDGQFKIQRYRPRTEGLFARIERWTKLDSGETHWRSLSKDNITTLYGRTTQSRIADPDDSTHVFSWLICESYDDKGNAICYEYKAENSDRVIIAQANERNRTPENRAVNRHLKHIHYGNQTPRQPNEDLSLRTDWMFEVVFDYGEHDQVNPKPSDSGMWMVRNDPFSSYRAGFEVRTYRLCQRVLMFHHFPEEEGVRRDCLVRSTDFIYSYEQNPTDVRNPIYSLLLSATQTGHKRSSTGNYIQKSLPPLEFTYSEPNIDETVRDIDRESLENLPNGLDGTRYQWVDLDGEGLSGILTEQGGGWFYKRNLSPINSVRDNGAEHIAAKFAPVELVASQPTIALASGAQFLDLAGDGRLDLVALRSTTPGFYERTQKEGWEPFVTFKSLPSLDWDNPNLKFIDLNGDGHSDILITEDNCFVWHPSLAEDGFDAAERVSQPWDEEKGPRVIFADSTQSIHLADMSGDGLTDIVRIRNGEVCYWANLGYGRFGAKVTMDNAPWFDAPDIFDQRRIQLADIDGSGTTDIIYLSGSGVQVYFNQSGNGWSVRRTLSYFPAIDSVASVTVIDLLGNGTACLVWSSPLPGNAGRVMRYIDLMGGQKPHLLLKTVNNMGAETVVQYAPSTKFYLQDKLAGTPWITKLPFPVHVVERVETLDRISGNRFVTRHAYHHGYFDGVEREFRGFGMVEQWDTEEFTLFTADGTLPATNLDAAFHVPPILTKTWFHTGAYIDRDRISSFFAHLPSERGGYYQEPGLTPEQVGQRLLDDTVLPTGLTLEEEREACRSLKGAMLRQEVYALDGTAKQPHPYSVAEQNYTIEPVQSFGQNQHAVFFTHARESLTYHYERNPADPRIGHEMVLEVDEFGNVLKSVAIAYPRRTPQHLEQEQLHATYTENRVTNKPNEADWYRLGLPIETLTYEITGISSTAGQQFIIPDFYAKDAADQVSGFVTAPEIPYDQFPDGTLQKRLIERVRALYRRNDQANTLDPTPLPLGEVESLALPCESYKLAFTPGLLAQVYDSKISTVELSNLLRNEGKYIEQDGVWWIPSGRQSFDPSRFYISTQMKDPFGGISTMLYDDYALLVVESRDTLPDPLTNVVRIRNNYRTMQPEQITDPNDNRAQVAFDALGMVAGTAVMGKETETKGDLLDGFKADLTQAEIDAFLANPLGMAASLLGNATTRIIYDLEQFRTDQQPAVAAAIARETHVGDPGGAQSKVQVSFSYSDGFGREVQQKVQAEPGDAPQREANAANPNRPGDLILENGQPKLAPTDPRWVGNGRTIFNNKGKPVKQYEPFFSSTHLYEDEPEMVMTGVTPILFYDPVERVVATLHPNHTYEKVVFDPWQQVTWDVNDTVLLDPKTDPNVGGFFQRLPDSDYLPTWHSEYSGSPDAEKQRAAIKAAAHAATPAIAHLDTLGRTFLTIADNGAVGKYETRVELDLEGNTVAVIDARNNAVMIYAVVQKDADGKPVKDTNGKPIAIGRAFDLLGHNLCSYSIDAGDRWMLNNVAGNPIRGWDSRGFVRRLTYDALQRPLALFVQDAQGEKLVEQTVYGEAQGSATNHRGQVYQVFDGAGVVTSQRYDFKRNLLEGSRQLLQNYKDRVDWSQNPTLENEPPFVSSTVYDALNRPITLTTPDNSTIRPLYNEANLLNGVDVNLQGAATATPFIKNIDYDAKGQRQLIRYGNDVVTTYEYDDKTFRLILLRTERGNPFTADRPKGIQNLFYTYDPVGNITEIRDDAQQTVFFNNAMVTPRNQYVYDALYRLIQAKGREHKGQVADPQPEYNSSDFPRMNLSHPNEISAMRDYTEQYEYDSVGNILRMIHQADNGTNNGTWIRRYDYELTNNRLRNTSLPGDLPDLSLVSPRYLYDEHGSMTKMPHLTQMDWDFKDQLQRVDLGGGGVAYYVYDAAGQRVRKVIERQNGSRQEERIYLGGFEIYRKYNGSGNTVTLERETLHIMDDQQRIALVETKTITNPDDESPTQLIRFQFGNHLGSASLELDDQANVISYEEYYPYGSTSYQAVDKSIKAAAKRYRYTGMERDEESGLNYHGARYYTPWLGRWTACDPIGIEGGGNLFVYAFGNPLMLADPLGTQPEAPDNFPQDEEGNFFLGELTIEVSGTAPPDAYGSAVRGKISNPLPTEEEYGTRLAAAINSRIYDWTSEGQEQSFEWAYHPERAKARWDKFVEAEYKKFGQREVAKLEESYRRMDNAANIGKAIGVGTVVAAGGLAYAAIAAPSLSTTIQYTAARAAEPIATGTKAYLAASVAYGVTMPPGSPDLPGPGNEVGSLIRRGAAAADGAPATAVYFRGTSAGFEGSPSLQRTGMTPATTDPVVGTIFATEGENYGRGVLHIATPADLAGVKISEGNWLAALEREVAIELAPAQFASRASTTITAAEARSALRSMGVKISSTIRTPEMVTSALQNTPRFTEAEIRRFLTVLKGGR
ncbi:MULTISPECIES: SpvB/TcaC N-terminal domain-containing protein [Cyanophyceae]|uniref:SpvB/TcaC N-terminal domain-containing protein n=1 Tax=Cyanophyceae TaxID=3028117 RepID=UPI001689F9CA|nr:SpvB/TcaC N-terminal domain-containing protein [Trichocoleus sp. FACHB-69]MBD1930315.1 VCBS repeat-containing protein [Trichocoleus sp. FACHB-69]